MHALHRLRDRLEDLELGGAVWLHLHDRCQVVAAITIVRGTPHCHQVFILHTPISYLKPKLVPFLHQLVGPSDQRYIIDVAEIIGDSGTKHPPSTSSIDGPILYVFGVGPD